MTTQVTTSAAEVALRADGQVAIRWPGDEVWHVARHGRPALAGDYTLTELNEEWTPVTEARKPEPRGIRTNSETIAELVSNRPWLASLMPHDVLMAIHHRLTMALDEDTARALTYDIELFVAGQRSRLPRQVTKLMEATVALREELARELANTTGLHWRSWARGFYMVTYDGRPIGGITPAQLDPVPDRIRKWQPHPAYIGGPPQPTTGTVTAAAEALRVLHTDRIAREAAETPAPEGSR